MKSNYDESYGFMFYKGRITTETYAFLSKATKDQKTYILTDTALYDFNPGKNPKVHLLKEMDRKNERDKELSKFIIETVESKVNVRSQEGVGKHYHDIIDDINERILRSNNDNSIEFTEVNQDVSESYEETQEVLEYLDPNTQSDYIIPEDNKKKVYFKSGAIGEGIDAFLSSVAKALHDVIKDNATDLTFKVRFNEEGSLKENENTNEQNEINDAIKSIRLFLPKSSDYEAFALHVALKQVESKVRLELQNNFGDKVSFLYENNRIFNIALMLCCAKNNESAGFYTVMNIIDYRANDKLTLNNVFTVTDNEKFIDSYNKHVALLLKHVKKAIVTPKKIISAFIGRGTLKHEGNAVKIDPENLTDKDRRLLNNLFTPEGKLSAWAHRKGYTIDVRSYPLKNNYGLTHLSDRDHILMEAILFEVGFDVMKETYEQHRKEGENDEELQNLNRALTVLEPIVLGYLKNPIKPWFNEQWVAQDELLDDFYEKSDPERAVSNEWWQENISPPQEETESNLEIKEEVGLSSLFLEKEIKILSEKDLEEIKQFKSNGDTSIIQKKDPKISSATLGQIRLKAFFIGLIAGLVMGVLVAAGMFYAPAIILITPIALPVIIGVGVLAALVVGALVSVGVGVRGTRKLRESEHGNKNNEEEQFGKPQNIQKMLTDAPTYVPIQGNNDNNYQESPNWNSRSDIPVKSGDNSSGMFNANTNQTTVTPDNGFKNDPN